MSDGELQIIVWNVEHGSAIYVRTPNDRHILLDAGASTEFSPANWLKNRHGIQQADLFILSHPDSDHIQDIENVDKLLNPVTFCRNKSTPRDLIYPTYPPEKNPLRYYHSFVARYNREAPADYQFEPRSNWGGVTIRTFGNSSGDDGFTKLNDYSLATFLLYGNLEFLFPGDLEAPGWQAMTRMSDFRLFSTPSSTNKDEVRILVAAHHGREAGVYRGFLDLYRPHLAIVSDKYGSPYTAYNTHYDATQGLWVYDRGQGEVTKRRVISTKTNNYILIRSNRSGVFVQI